MSTTNEPAPQTNPEQEQGASSDTLSPHRTAPKVATSPPTTHTDDLNGLHAAAVTQPNNGTNGMHHDDSDARLISGEASSDGETPTDEVDILTNGLSTPRSAVKIKGRPGGVSLELGEGEWDELIDLLEDRLNAAEGFFRGGRVVLDVGPRPLIEDHLRQVRQLLETHEMKLGVVRSTAERTIQAALEVGVSTSNEEQEPLYAPEMPAFQPTDKSDEVAAVAPSTFAPPAAGQTRPADYVHRGSLRSGQVLRKTESIVIIGDVNPGAQVISGGDVMVWGRLRGVAHAGADGNRRAVVTAIDFVPTQLRIAHLTAVAPEQKKGRGLMFWKKEPERRPEIARVVDGRIVVEPWDESKPNGLGVWRK